MKLSITETKELRYNNIVIILTEVFPAYLKALKLLKLFT